MATVPRRRSIVRRRSLESNLFETIHESVRRRRIFFSLLIMYLFVAGPSGGSDSGGGSVINDEWKNCPLS